MFEAKFRNPYVYSTFPDWQLIWDSTRNGFWTPSSWWLDYTPVPRMWIHRWRVPDGRTLAEWETKPYRMRNDWLPLPSDRLGIDLDRWTKTISVRFSEFAILFFRPFARESTGLQQEHCRILRVVFVLFIFCRLSSAVCVCVGFVVAMWFCGVKMSVSVSCVCFLWVVGFCRLGFYIYSQLVCLFASECLLLDSLSYSKCFDSIFWFSRVVLSAVELIRWFSVGFSIFFYFTVFVFRFCFFYSLLVFIVFIVFLIVLILVVVVFRI